MDLQIRMDWHRGGSIISNGAWGTIKEKRASNVSESKMSVPAKWLVQIGQTWEEVFEVLGTWDNKLSKSYKKKWSIRIRSDLFKLWVVDGIEKKSICSRKTTWRDT